MELQKLQKIWDSGNHNVWYCYEGIFTPVNLWNQIYHSMELGNEAFYDAIVNYMTKNNGFMHMYLPMSVKLDFNYGTLQNKKEFQVLWNKELPDICGYGAFGSVLGIAENDQNVCETFEECVDECEAKNRKRVIYFQPDHKIIMSYFKILKGIVDKCYQ